MDGKPFNRPWEWVETKTAQDKAEEAGGTDALLELKQLLAKRPPPSPLRCCNCNETSLHTTLM